MHDIGAYVYDPERLLFYRNNLATRAIAAINAHVGVDNDYARVREMLHSYDADEIRVRPAGLKKAGICLTNNCSFRCGYCSASSAEGTIEPICMQDVLDFASDVMKRWTVNRLMGEGDEPLRLDFTGGGEPTYDWNLFHDAVTGIRQKAKDNNIPLSLGITTNGLLESSQTDFIATWFESAMVSYDGIPEIHNRNRPGVRGVHTSDGVEAAIRDLATAGLHVTVRTTIWQDDFHHMKAMADHVFGSFAGDIEWTVLPVIPAGRALDRARKSRRGLAKHDFLEKYLETVEYARQRHGDVAINTPIFGGDLTTVYCGAIVPFCSCPWLLPDKTIVTCIESCEQKTVIGRVHDGRVEYFEKCRDPLFKVYQEKFDECRDCIAYRFCKGGCPVRHLMNRNAPTEIGNWECSTIRMYWEYVFLGVLERGRCFGWKAVPVEIAGVENGSAFVLTRVEEEGDETQRYERECVPGTCRAS